MVGERPAVLHFQSCVGLINTDYRRQVVLPFSSGDLNHFTGESTTGIGVFSVISVDLMFNFRSGMRVVSKLFVV